MKSYTLLFLSFQVVEAIINVQTAYAGDAANGMRVFNTYCSDCHSITEGKNKIGPSLWNVVGRRPASISDFNYSDAMRKNDIIWTEDRISTYITNPQGLLPGVKMAFPGLKDPQKCADVIQFLSQQH